ncbi:unnamed protein product [Caenorhabditis bovis]|uniref:MADF domain-containing protein n=1 Tax=Caenorhabditis bovis TaxID=2654633 RepID=A0A8S1E4D5_9PELO|nr:unnamed protein product [Caenorhabditis bovis]
MPDHRDSSPCDPIDDEFTAKLIEMVQDNPCVYDKHDPMNKLAHVKNEVWNVITKELDFDGHPVELERKWRHLRDKYVRLRKQEKLHGPLKKTNRWINFYARMSFLAPFIEHRNRKRKDDENEEACDSDKKEEYDVDMTPNETLNQFYANLLSTDELISPKEEPAPTTTSSNSMSARYSDASRFSQSSPVFEPTPTPPPKKRKTAAANAEGTPEESEVSLFVRSIAKTLEAMDPRTFSIARLEIAKVLHSCQYGDLKP